MEIILLIIGLIALIPVAYLLWDKYAVKPHKVDIDYKNTIIARFIDPQSNYHEKFGLAFYALNILNSSKENLTIKNFTFQYRLNDTNYSTESLVLLTGKVYAPLEKKDVNAIIVQNGPDKIVLMNWNNMRSEIAKNNTLPPGGVLSGSAFFVFDFDTIDSLKELENPAIVITDYRDKKTVHRITIEEELIKRAEHALIENKSFNIEG